MLGELRTAELSHIGDTPHHVCAESNNYINNHQTSKWDLFGALIHTARYDEGVQKQRKHVTQDLYQNASTPATPKFVKPQKNLDANFLHTSPSPHYLGKYNLTEIFENDEPKLTNKAKLFSL